jgi:hypothetical protein
MVRKKTRAFAFASAAVALAVFGAAQNSSASDHDDGEIDLKARALNLTDHFVFKSGSELAFVMYFNPRALPQKQYLMSTNARYEFHVAKVPSKIAPASTTDSFVFRFEAGAPSAAGVQPITLTILKDGAVIGTHTGMSTDFATSKANTGVTVNQGSAGGVNFKYFVGMRADSFHFDVIRYFQVRSFLASRFFGGASGNGNANATIAPNCRGDAFLQGVLGTETNPDADGVNLFNPPSCAPDFTKNYNVTSITMNVPIGDLGGTVFDTWSTISVKQ